MSADAWITLLVVLATVATLASERVRPVVAVLAGTVSLFVLGVVDTASAFAGFSNPAPITVAALYVVAGAVETTGALEWASTRMTRGVTSVRAAGLARLLPIPLVSSAFLNNTTIVAMLAPRVEAWAKRVGQPVSGVLIPLSFVAILGGVITTIGTSTNLVVSGLLEEAGFDALGLFEITKVGLPVAVGGALLLLLATPRLLPLRTTRTPRSDGIREFTVEMVVAPGGALAGRSVREAGLRNLAGVYLVELERQGHSITPVPPEEVLVGDDRLTFAGDVEQILDLHRLQGLAPAEERHFTVADDGAGGRVVYELVVAPGSEITGKTLKELGFRNRYAAAVVAVHRAGERLPGKLGTIPLRPGDVLLALSDDGLRERVAGHRDFLVVARLDGQPPPRRHRARLVELILLALLVMVGLGLVDILKGSLLAAFAVIAVRAISVDEARRAIDLDVVVLIAASFGLGAAIAESGLAEQVAGGLVAAFGGFGDVALLAGVLVATIALTELITNNAAAVMMFPIAVSAATEAGLDPRGFAVAVAIGASASFLTPIGYQTNTMVYGMGGYRFGDFARVGAPLSVAVVAISLAVIPVAWPLSG